MMGTPPPKTLFAVAARIRQGHRLQSVPPLDVLALDALDIQHAIASLGGNLPRVAKALGVSPETLRRYAREGAPLTESLAMLYLLSATGGQKVNNAGRLIQEHLGLCSSNKAKPFGLEPL